MSELIACHHKVTLDIAKRDVCTIEVVNQDTANILEVNVCENGKEVSLENATLVTITYSNDTVDEMQISEDFKTAFIRINANCLKQGINFAKVCIYSGDNGLITAEMLTINCKQTVGSDNPAVPDPDMPKLKEMIEDAVAQAGGGAGLEPLIGTNETLTPTQVREAFLQGQPIVLEYIYDGEALVKFQSFELYEDIIVANAIMWRSGSAGDIYAVHVLTGDVLSNKWDFSATVITNPEDIQKAINDALAAAKASGEFDGADGITPTIGDNGNWFLGDTDTGKPSRGEKGDKGDTGATGATGAIGADGKSAYSYAVEGGYTGTAEEFAAKLAAEKLPNPYPLTFTGAVSETYDGSSAKTIEIPSGGTGGGGALSGLAIADNYDIELISHVIIDQENIPTAGITVTQKDDGSPFAYDGLLIWTDAKSASSYTTFNFNGYTNYPIEMTHGNKNLLSVYITDGTTMSIIIDRVRNIIKQSHADTGNIFYPDAIFQRVPEKFTSFKIGADGIASVKFYKAWGLTRK